MTIFGVDVHPVYQLLMRLRKSAKEGYKVCFVKVSEGSSYRPTGLRLYWHRVKRAGFSVIGCYHFLNNEDGDKQAAYFCHRVNKIGGPKNKVLIVDFEAYGDKTPSNATLKKFVAGVKRRFPGKKVLLYSGYGFWTGGDASGDASQYDVDGLWDARYAATDKHQDPKAYWYRVKDWWLKQPTWGGTPPPKRIAGQFTSAGRVGGLYVDTNVFFVTEDELKKFAGQTTTPTEPTTPEYIRKPVAYIERCLGGPYVAWVSGRFDQDEPPAWCVNRPPPEAFRVRNNGGFCASVLNLMCRVNGKYIFKDTSTSWAGGVKWWGERIRDKKIGRPYDPEKHYPVGTVFIRFYTGSALKDQGHVAVQGRNGRLLQSDAFESITKPGYNEKRTHRETNNLLIKFDGGGWHQTVAPEDWLR